MARSYVRELLIILAKRRDERADPLVPSALLEILQDKMSDDSESMIPSLARLTELLNELVGIGVISEIDNGTYSLPPRSDFRGDASPPPGGPINNGDGDNGSDDESGLDAVLRHPVLFAYSDIDFEQAINEALSIYE